MKKRDVVAALELIRARNKGLLRPTDVVRAARGEGHPLHGRFEWDDTKAARAHRLWQAREMIRVSVTILPTLAHEVPAYVSFKADRVSKGGGYRAMSDIVADPKLRKVMLAEALTELRVFRERYKLLEDLRPLFGAIAKALKKGA